MASVRIPMKDARFLVESGASPAVHEWLPLRMAAANGDLAMIEWLLRLSEPSGYTLGDAVAWAAGKGRLEAAAFLRAVATSRSVAAPDM